MNKTIIVTGGCGYIGSHVARAFKNAGDHVFVIDRVFRKHTVKNLDGWFIEDFASDACLSTIIDLNPDIIVHCAGTSLVAPSVTDPAEYYVNNVVKTIKMLDVIKNMDKKPWIMFSSSASVYGNPAPHRLPLKENEHKNPISPYGNTKSMVEDILKDYTAYGIDSVCFRYFNAAGAMPVTADLGQEPGATHIVARVLEASIANRAFTINGDDYETNDGTCIRDYVHVWDIAQAHIRATEFLHRAVSTRTADCHIFNLGTNKGISNKEIVDYVYNNYGLPFVNYGPRRAGDPSMLIADASDATTWLGWEPKHSSMEEIIDSAYTWYISQ
jgi:UDP-glucose 4-epimerase